MERNPFEADPKRADIYSLAKTFWILITKNPQSFEGQYDILDHSISILKYISNTNYEYLYLGIIHQILRRSTANDPKERPQINEILELLEVFLSDDIDKLCRHEWIFLKNEIIHSNPKTIIWENPIEIYNILNIVSKTHGLNHTFLPSGGGLDLYGVKYYSSNNLIELYLQLYYVVKPKKLQLSLFPDPQWNHFFLEVEPNSLVDCGKDIFNEYFSIDENTYVETWWQNYNEYEGKPIPKTAKRVIVYQQGSFVIFPKRSFYNLHLGYQFFRTKDGTEYIVDPYGSFHNKIGNADNFRYFIDNLIKYINNEKYDDFFYQTVLRNATKIEANNSKLKANKDKDEYMKSYKWIDFAKVINPFIESSLDEYFIYYIDLSLTLSHHYILLSDFSLKEQKTMCNFEDLIENDKVKSSTYLFLNNYSNIKKIVNIIKNEIIETIQEPMTIDDIDISFKSKRKYQMVKPIFEKDDLKRVLYSGDDTINCNLVVDQIGELLLVNHEIFMENEQKYSACLYSFDHHQNILGKNSGERLDDFINYHYLDFLTILRRHLSSGLFVCSGDDYLIDNEKKIKDDILNLNCKYELKEI